MTNLTDQQRAEGLVDARLKINGVIIMSALGDDGTTYSINSGMTWVSASVIVSDPRVAMECLKRMSEQEILIWSQHYEEADSVWIVELGDSPRGAPSDGRDESLERAIVDAYLESVK